jgi:hypothetical protein
MPSPPERRKLGLEGVHEARERRLEGRFSRPTGRAYAVLLVGLIASLLIYRFVSGRELGSRRSALLAKQRADEVTIGQKWAPLRDRLEKFVTDRAGAFGADKVVQPDAKAWAGRVDSGIYLRLRLEDAGTPKKIRDAAHDSARDAFVGCLLRGNNAALAHGDPDAGVVPEQPWNLRQAYAATRILTPEWVAQVKDADDSLRLRIFEQQYDKAEREEIPRAIDIIQKSDFFLLVLDEPADDPNAVKPRWTDGGVDSKEEAVQLVPHWVRVHVLDLKKNEEILRLRRRADATFVPAGGRPVRDDETLDAMQRQVNNCSLAQQVRAAIQ